MREAHRHAQSKDPHTRPEPPQPPQGVPARCPEATPRNTSLQDDAQQSPKSTAPAPARIRKSAAPQHSPPASAAQTASSDPPDSGTPDNRTNNAIRDIFDGTSRECAANPDLRFPILHASFCDEIRQAPPPSPRSGRAGTDTSYTRHLQTGVASRSKLLARS